MPSINDFTFKADGGSDSLKKDLIQHNIAKPEQIYVAGKSGNRNNDNPYFTIIQLANGELSLHEATANMSTRIRVKNMLESLKAL